MAVESDLALVEQLTEDTLLTKLEWRYYEKKVYTWIGDILVAINPFEPLPIYDTHYQALYQQVREDGGEQLG